jgi:hypothetical protein
MKQRLDKIRQLLSELEGEVEIGTPVAWDRDFSALELPLIIQEIVDDLQPLLSRYEAAFYWNAFRHSIARNGAPLLRFSTNRLRSGVVRSSRSDTISQGHVRETLAALEAFGAIRKEGDPNRDGTPYRVLIPDEIEACRKFRSERTAAQPKPEIAPADIDFYNVRGNRIKVYERDSYKCRYCQKNLPALPPR